jgi:hypothetical protein
MTLHNQVGNSVVSQMIAVQRDAAEEMHEHGAGCGHGPAVQASAVENLLRRPGSPVEPVVQAKAEAAAGTPLPPAVVHTGPAADQVAHDLGSIAFTTRSRSGSMHMVLSQKGNNLPTKLHEAKHLYQQAAGAVTGVDNGAGLSIGPTNAPEESDADNFSNRAMGMSVPAPGSAGHDDEM